MKYDVYCDRPHRQFLWLELSLETEASASELFLQMPAWRPGRYQIQNYAKLVRRFEVKDAQGAALPCRKVRKDRWRLDLSSHAGGTVRVRYEYYAADMNAGSTYLDDSQLQLNFIACALQVEGREDEPVTVQLHLPEGWQTATPLPQKDGLFHAEQGFYELVDSPILASASLQRQSYEVAGHDFHVWFNGNVKPDWETIIADFRAFTEEQLALFGQFPEPEYHFFLQILPYRHYHGVEHERSTVIVLGPDAEFGSKGFYDNLLGISSHELFHAWNVCKIRPAEMRPYRFAEETYTQAGFVLEGVTTYYGDLMLWRSGVFSDEDYTNELNMLFRRHFDNGGRHHKSLADSSFDLWLDGYDLPTPDRKVSIYVKGALIATVLHFELLRLSEGRRSLDDVMRLMWQRFGQPEKGYTVEEYIQAVEEVAGRDMSDYFQACLYGTEDLERRLKKAFAIAGVAFTRTESERVSEKDFGMQLRLHANSSSEKEAIVVRIAEGSPADGVLAVGDLIVSVNGEKDLTVAESALSFHPFEEHTLGIVRRGRPLTVKLRKTDGSYFPRYTVAFPTADNELFAAWKKGPAMLTRSADA